MLRSSGFTLIELLAVMVIVGVMSAVLTLAVGSLSTRDDERELQRLRLVLEASAERAAVRGQPVSVEFFADGYRFFVLDLNDNWHPLIDPPLFTERMLPPAALKWTSLTVIGRSDSRRLVFGARSPDFILRVATAKGEARLLGKANGEVSLELPRTLAAGAFAPPGGGPA